MSDERPEHIGHGEGMSTFIGRVHGCPACDVIAQRDADAAGERFAARLREALDERKAHPNGTWDRQGEGWRWRPRNGWVDQLSIPFDAIDSFPPLVEARAELERLRSLTEGDPTSIYAEAGALRGEVDGLRAENARLREALRETARLAQTVHDLTGHWSECPAPPDADCDLCHDYFAAVAALAASLSETGGE